MNTTMNTTIPNEWDNKMRGETYVTVTYRAYHTPAPDCLPTCASNVADGSACCFLRTQRFGTEHVCLLTEPERRGLRPPLESRNGYLVPHASCPLHAPINPQFINTKRKP